MVARLNERLYGLLWRYVRWAQYRHAWSRLNYERVAEKHAAWSEYGPR